MTRNSRKPSRMGLCLLTLAAHPAFASIVAGDLPARPGEDGAGIGYHFQVYLDATAGPASETWAGSVKSKAWSDPSNLPGPLGIPLGWTHNSNWAYLDLQADAKVEIRLAPDGSDLVPAMTLWSGADNAGANWHTYEQNTVPFWVDAPGFTYLNHRTTGPGPFANQSATLSMFLPAGEYTVAIGGHDLTAAGHDTAYAFTVSATPVPLPAAAPLFGSAWMGITALRRRGGQRHLKKTRP